MAWLQSSFTNQQLIGDNKTSNLRKGYKVGSLNKNTDPDKSNTPLLIEGPLVDFTTDCAVTESCGKSISEPKKPNILQNFANKPSFLSSNFFDRSTNIIKTKPLPNIQSPTETTTESLNIPKEGKNLMSFCKNNQPPVEEKEDSDEDSDDEWFSPHASRGYQKVKTGAD
ncbi:hypothetical protein JTE90_006591 [Oedothorax gibbosus]|uniref:Exophilin 5 n=1 Tax=Oedothorax gibbosus TaxID=931172 RepID=A0AAV6VLS6_9ARAC|nr:hypothetical protein JTE90_006591 [Oedothorax gibbosus]